jgi:hypothetical protein
MNGVYHYIISDYVYALRHLGEHCHPQVETARQTAELLVAYQESDNEGPARSRASSSNPRWPRVSSTSHFVSNAADHTISSECNGRRFRV